MTERTDPHRPSVLVPADYRFVAPNVVKIEGLGDIQYLEYCRKLLREDMARTGGKYSTHAHGGNCMVCGSVNAIYTVVFHHAKTNTYIRMGSECAEHVDMGGWEGDYNKLRRAAKQARARVKGKQKAHALLEEAELLGLYDAIETEKKNNDAYNAMEAKFAADCEERGIRPSSGEAEELWREIYEHQVPRASGDVLKLRDVLRTIERKGVLSEKQKNFIRTLLDRIARRPEIEAKRAAEKEAAKDAPKGRMEVEGEVLKAENRETAYGTQFVMTVKTTDGWLCWGTVPSSIDMITVEVGPKPEQVELYRASLQDMVTREIMTREELNKGLEEYSKKRWPEQRVLQRGDKVRFTAAFEPARNDPKFAFFKRPTKASLLTPLGEQAYGQ